MGFYLHMFMTVFLPCVYGHRPQRPKVARVAPQPTLGAPFGKIK